MASNHGSDRRWMLLFVAAALLLGATRWHFTGQSSGLRPLADRKLVSDLTLTQLDGGVWRLGDHGGQVVLINYWATWCAPCRDELPGLLQVARESGPHGLAVVGVSLDTAPSVQAREEIVRQFVRKFRLPYPIAFPDKTLEMESGDIGLPTTVLIDKHGRAAKTYAGEVPHSILARDVAALLAES